MGIFVHILSSRDINMNQPIVRHGSSYNEIKMLTVENKYISYPFKFSDVRETERQGEIRQLFRKHNYSRLDDEVEIVIECLNEMCDTSIVKVSEPFGDLSSSYNIDFGDIEAYVVINDDYYGRDYISLEGVIVKEDVTDERVMEVADWLDKAFNG